MSLRQIFELVKSIIDLTVPRKHPTRGDLFWIEQVHICINVSLAFSYELVQRTQIMRIIHSSTATRPSKSIGAVWVLSWK